jgi:hypothetical protein
MPFSPTVAVPDPFSPPVAGRLNPDTVGNPTHRPTTTLTSSVEARPVDSVEPRFTGENGERPTRMKQGNGDRGGFSAESGFGNGHSMLGRNWVREWTIDSRPDLGSRRPDLGTDLGLRSNQRNPHRCAWVYGRISWVCWISDLAGVPDPDHRAARSPSSPAISPLLPTVLSQAPFASRPWKLRSPAVHGSSIHGNFHLDLAWMWNPTCLTVFS